MQVTADLRQRIRSGEFALGAKLPSLRTLAEHYEVSEVTAHTAIRTLQQDGVLESTSGRGTFVRSIPADEAAGQSIQTQIDDLRTEVQSLSARVKSLESHGQQSTAKRRRKP